MNVDLNCDLGEGFPFDAELMPLITSANICCGAHAGDAQTSLAALLLACRHGVQVGAHPGFADREHFGRRDLHLPAAEVYRECARQVASLCAQLRTVAETALIGVRYIKPHGALYNMACRDRGYAETMARLARDFGCALMGLPDTLLQECARECCPFIVEGFADRRYQSDGTLVPRSRPGAFVEDTEEAVCQAEWLLQRGVQTLCVHGDNPRAVEFVRALRQALLQRGHTIAPCRTS